MSLSDYVIELVEYSYALLPVSLAMLAIPPLSLFSIVQTEQLHPSVMEFFRVLYSIVPRELMQKAFIESLLLDSANEGRPSAHITHMFVHYNFQHLFSNLSGLWGLGFPVFHEFGGLLLNAIFIGGGIAGSVKGDWQDMTLSFPKEIQDVPLTSIANLADVATKAVNKTVDAVVRTVDKSRRHIYMGASGGVFALLGCNLVLLARSTYECVEDIKRMSKKPQVVTTENKAAVVRNVSGVVWNVLRVSSILGVIETEWSSHSEQVGKQLGLMDLFRGGTVNHAAHLQGFLFGVGVTCGLLFVQRAGYGKKSKSSKEI